MFLFITVHNQWFPIQYQNPQKHKINSVWCVLLSINFLFCFEGVFELSVERLVTLRH